MFVVTGVLLFLHVLGSCIGLSTVTSRSSTTSFQGNKPQFMATLYANDPIGRTLSLTSGNY
ncbi:unnamed protein product, partial [Rotaria sp. Silwood2]